MDSAVPICINLAVLRDLHVISVCVQTSLTFNHQSPSFHILSPFSMVFPCPCKRLPALSQLLQPLALLAPPFLFETRLDQEVQEGISNPVGQEQAEGIALGSVERAILVVDDAYQNTSEVQIWQLQMWQGKKWKRSLKLGSSGWNAKCVWLETSFLIPDSVGGPCMSDYPHSAVISSLSTCSQGWQKTWQKYAINTEYQFIPTRPMVGCHSGTATHCNQGAIKNLSK